LKSTGKKDGDEWEQFNAGIYFLGAFNLACAPELKYEFLYSLFLLTSSRTLPHFKQVYSFRNELLFPLVQ